MSRHIFEEKLFFFLKKKKKKKSCFRKGERERYFVTVLAFVWVGERTQVQLLDRGKRKKKSHALDSRGRLSLSAAVFVYLTISFGWLLPTRRDEEYKGNIRHKIYTRTN